MAVRLRCGHVRRALSRPESGTGVAVILRAQSCIHAHPRRGRPCREWSRRHFPAGGARRFGAHARRDERVRPRSAPFPSCSRAAAARSGPLKVSTTRKLITSADFWRSSSMPVTSAAKSAFDHSNHCAGGASCAKRQASAAVATTTSMAGTSRRNLIAAIVRFPRVGCRVMHHVHPIRA